jgi:heptosyltransferase-2
LVRKGNESLFESHPFLNQVLVWDKKNNKYQNWVGLLFKIRSRQYDVVLNAQRFAATGAWTAFSKAKIKIGFDKNPFSFLFTNTVVHQFSEKGQHEIDRNHQLLSCLFETKVAMPKLYPTASDELAVINYQQTPYLCIAPASVWFTKQFSSEKWVDLINALPFKGPIYLIG